MPPEQDSFYNLSERIENMFSEIDSDICTDLRNNNSEYTDMWIEIGKLQKTFPIIKEIIDKEDAVSLSAEEHKAFNRYLDLQREMENMERKQIYFRGHADNFAYLKRIGAI